MQSITVKNLNYVPTWICDFKVRMFAGMAWWTAFSHWAAESHLVWWHEDTSILSTGTCLEVRGHPVRGNPHSNLTRPRDSANQMCCGAPVCPPNSPTNRILIEFQQTCKNLFEFFYLIFLTDVPVIPVKRSAMLTFCVWKHIKWLGWLVETKSWAGSWDGSEHDWLKNL